jgi:UPF0716 protein FxsA
MPVVFVLFVLIPLLELLLLIRVGGVIGAGPTVLLVIVTGLVGASLARMQGFRVLRDIERDLERGRLPTGSLLQGLLVLVGAAFLLTPGILTDAAGLLLMVPEARRRLAPLLGRWFRRYQNARTFRVEYPPGWDARGPRAPREVREVEVREVAEEPAPRRDDDEPPTKESTE